MAAWATEAGVRLQLQVEDVSVLSAELIAACIGEAHETVLAQLDSAVDLDAPPAAVVQGETLLAGACAMRALATRDAVEQVELQVGGQRIDSGQRFAALMSMARRFDKEGMALLAPHGEIPDVQTPGTCTPTVPVLGDGAAG